MKTHLACRTSAWCRRFPERRLTIVINNGVPGSFAEAFRAIRTNVLFSSTGTAGDRSRDEYRPRQGKSIVSSNLAIGSRRRPAGAAGRRGHAQAARAHLAGVTQEPGLSNGWSVP